MGKPCPETCSKRAKNCCFRQWRRRRRSGRGRRGARGLVERAAAAATSSCPFCPRSRRGARVSDRRVLEGARRARSGGYESVSPWFPRSGKACRGARASSSWTAPVRGGEPKPWTATSPSWAQTGSFDKSRSSPGHGIQRDITGPVGGAMSPSSLTNHRGCTSPHGEALVWPLRRASTRMVFKPSRRPGRQHGAQRPRAHGLRPNFKPASASACTRRTCASPAGRRVHEGGPALTAQVTDAHGLMNEGMGDLEHSAIVQFWKRWRSRSEKALI